VCTRLVISAGSPHALYDMHISQVLGKYAELTGHTAILSFPFSGFRRIETAREEIAREGVVAYTEKRLVCNDEGEPLRTLVPVASFSERGQDGQLRKVEKSGLATFILMKNRTPQGAGWYLVTEAGSHGVEDRHGNQRQPWLRQAEQV